MDAVVSVVVAALNRLPVLGLIGLAATSVLIGDVLAKFWSIHQRPILLVGALIAYAGSGFFYTPTLLRSGLVITSLIWVLASTTGFLVIGIIFFHETLSLPQMVGVLFGLIALVLLTIE